MFDLFGVLDHPPLLDIGRVLLLLTVEQLDHQRVRLLLQNDVHEFLPRVLLSALLVVHELELNLHRVLGGVVLVLEELFQRVFNALFHFE